MNLHSGGRAVVISERQLTELHRNIDGILRVAGTAVAYILDRKAGHSPLATHPQARLLRPAIGLAVVAIAISLLLFAVGDISDDETTPGERSGSTRPAMTTKTTPIDSDQGAVADNTHKKDEIDKNNMDSGSTSTRSDGAEPTTTQQFAKSHSVKNSAAATPTDNTKAQAITPLPNSEKNARTTGR